MKLFKKVSLRGALTLLFGIFVLTSMFYFSYQWFTIPGIVLACVMISFGIYLLARDWPKGSTYDQSSKVTDLSPVHGCILFLASVIIGRTGLVPDLGIAWTGLISGLILFGIGVYLHKRKQRKPKGRMNQ
jgi:hypothetical protein